MNCVYVYVCQSCLLFIERCKLTEYLEIFVFLIEDIQMLLIAFGHCKIYQYCRRVAVTTEGISSV